MAEGLSRHLHYRLPDLAKRLLINLGSLKDKRLKLATGHDRLCLYSTHSHQL